MSNTECTGIQKCCGCVNMCFHLSVCVSVKIDEWYMYGIRVNKIIIRHFTFMKTINTQQKSNIYMTKKMMAFCMKSLWFDGNLQTYFPLYK